ncbi:MAG: NTP transferase domain-containing protein [Rhizomicrobium sp.]
MRIAGLVIAGGLATRMKADKPFVSFQSGFLLDAVIDRVKPQVDILMLNVRTEHIALCRFRYGDEFALVPDAFNGNAGPLGGVVAGLQRLPSLGAQWLATFPCDTPFIPRHIVSTLLRAAQQATGKPAVAVAAGQVQSLCALWPYQCMDVLHDGVASGRYRSVWRALDMLQAVRVDASAEPHAFFNVNTRDDLAEAERLARDDGMQT